MKKTFLAFAACVVLTGAVSAQGKFVAVSEILGARCATCHEWAASYRGIADPARVVASFPEKSLLYQVVSTDRMPRSGVTLSAEEKAVIKAWIAAGALRNESAPYPAASDPPSGPVPESCPCGLN